jgi:mRNA-degrading endonuclease RelE of RelBE toxin-antitoxin system
MPREGIMARDQGIKRIEEKIKQLPPELRKDVEEFVEGLLENPERKARKRLQFKWRGALRDLRDKYTSVDLQHKISEW